METTKVDAVPCRGSAVNHQLYNECLTLKTGEILKFDFDDERETQVRYVALRQWKRTQLVQGRQFRFEKRGLSVYVTREA